MGRPRRDRPTESNVAQFTEAASSARVRPCGCLPTGPARTVNEDGSPHVTAVGALWVEGTVWFQTGVGRDLVEQEPEPADLSNCRTWNLSVLDRGVRREHPQAPTRAPHLIVGCHRFAHHHRP